MLLTHSETVQLRVEMFNPRNAAIIAVSNTTMNLSNPTDSAPIANLPFDSNLGLTAESRQQNARGLHEALPKHAPSMCEGVIQISR